MSSGSSSTWFPLQHELGLMSLPLFACMCERIAQRLGSAPLLGNIIAGLLLGPALLDVVPFSDAITLAGQVGVMLLVIDSALTIDVDGVRQVGIRALFVAFVGVIGPVVLTMIIYTSVASTEGWTATLALGAALAPTSLGFSAQLLRQFDRLHSPLGQLIATAAVIDDVLALLLLTEIQALQGTSASAWTLIRPALASIGSLVIGGAGCLVLAPCVPATLEKLSNMLSKASNENDTKGPIDGDLTVAAILLLSAIAAVVCAYIGSSPLLGCFVASLAFSRCSQAYEAWTERAGVLVEWLARLFFAATVSFPVPSLRSGPLLSWTSIGRSIPLTLCAIVGKLIAGFLAPSASTHDGTATADEEEAASSSGSMPEKPLCGAVQIPDKSSFFQLGWAMNGRGEFSFLIATEAAADNLIDTNDYAAVVIALLLSTFVAPIAFRAELRRGEKSATSSS